MLDFHKNHKNLVIVSLLVFAGLSILIAVLPAYQMQKTQPLPTMQPLTTQELNGLSIYNTENCMACHTQQVRNIEMDKVWGERPSMASDYYYSKMRLDVWRQSPSLLGSERTGPDLTNAGKRQPGREWHLIHLYNPRIVVKESVMPSYPWLFEEKYETELSEDDVVVPVPARYQKSPHKKVVATQKVLDLVAYLQSLKQAPISGVPPVDFIPAVKKDRGVRDVAADELPYGMMLYTNTCAACHQPDGQGLVGAFPALAGSAIVNDENPETLIRIILQGYDARPEYGVMPGFADLLSNEEVAAIANHERANWGNKAKPISTDEVKRIREYIQNTN